LKGYAAGKDRNVNITHNFFVDDLKLYSSTLNGIKKQLDLVTTYSNDIGMQFGQEKCAYLVIEKGKTKSDGKNIVINQLKLNQLEEGDTYKYLGMDKNI